MKKIGLVAAMFAMGAFAETFKGTITDANCGAKHADASEASEACSKRCVGRGTPAVLIVGDTVIKFDDGSKAKIADLIGKKVVVNGSVKDGVLSVADIKAAE